MKECQKYNNFVENLIVKLGKTKIISAFFLHKIENGPNLKRGGCVLNEKQREIVEQYDVLVESSFRNRGCLHLVTDKGLFMITPYQGSPMRLACECELQMRLTEAGFTRVDRVIPNKENGLIVYDKYRSPFIMKQAYEGRECNLKEEKDVRLACRNLARLHRTLRLLEDYKVEKRETPLIPEMLKGKTLELKRIRNYIKKSGRRTEFELTFSSCYEQFYGEAMEALTLAQGLTDTYWKRGYGICHGAYHQHNVLLDGEEVTTLNLGQFHYNQQILDFYNILRKAMEKNQYSIGLMEAAVAAYKEELDFEKEDAMVLYILFSFPEKFWKISNQYYNSKKCWMPPKNLEKLKKTVEQNEKRRKFLQEWRKNECLFL